MNMGKRIATGRATCKICKKLIAKGLPCMHETSYQSTGVAHLSSCDDIAILTEMTK